MAIDVRKGTDEVGRALVDAHNDLLKKVTEQLSSYPHADVTSTTSGDYTAKTATPYLATGTASGLSSSIALANELKLVYNTHAADGIAHKTADDTNVVTTVDATTLATASALVNDVKAKFNAHLTQADVHYTNDTTNSCGTADSTSGDQTSVNTLANALKTKLNAHIQFALGASVVNLVGP